MSYLPGTTPCSRSRSTVPTWSFGRSAFYWTDKGGMFCGASLPRLPETRAQGTNSGLDPTRGPARAARENHSAAASARFFRWGTVGCLMESRTFAVSGRPRGPRRRPFRWPRRKSTF